MTDKVFIAKQQQEAPSTVYAMTNPAGSNEVVVFNRDAKGRLTQAGSYATSPAWLGTVGLFLGQPRRKAQGQGPSPLALGFLWFPSGRHCVELSMPVTF